MPRPTPLHLQKINRTSLLALSSISLTTSFASSRPSTSPPQPTVLMPSTPQIPRPFPLRLNQALPRSRYPQQSAVEAPLEKKVWKAWRRPSALPWEMDESESRRMSASRPSGLAEAAAQSGGRSDSLPEAFLGRWDRGRDNEDGLKPSVGFAGAGLWWC